MITITESKDQYCDNKIVFVFFKFLTFQNCYFLRSHGWCDDDDIQLLRFYTNKWSLVARVNNNKNLLFCKNTLFPIHNYIQASTDPQIIVCLFWYVYLNKEERLCCRGKDSKKEKKLLLLLFNWIVNVVFCVGGCNTVWFGKQIQYMSLLVLVYN